MSTALQTDALPLSHRGDATVRSDIEEQKAGWGGFALSFFPFVLFLLLFALSP